MKKYKLYFCRECKWAWPEDGSTTVMVPQCGACGIRELSFATGSAEELRFFCRNNNISAAWLRDV